MSMLRRLMMPSKPINSPIVTTLLLLLLLPSMRNRDMMPLAAIAASYGVKVPRQQNYYGIPSTLPDGRMGIVVTILIAMHLAMRRNCNVVNLPMPDK